MTLENNNVYYCTLCKVHVFKFTINTFSHFVTFGFISAPSRTYTLGMWGYFS